VAVIVAGALALIWLRDVNASLSSSALGIVAVLAALGALSEIVGFSQGKATTGSVGLVPITAALIIAPNWLTVVLAVSGQTIVFAFQRRQRLKVMYNAAQASLSLSLGALVFVAVGGAPTVELGSRSFVEAGQALAVPTVLLVLVIWSVNSVLVASAVCLTTNTKFLPVVRKAAQTTTSLTLLSAIFAFYLAWLSTNLGLVGTAGMVLPLIAVRQLYRATIELTSVTEELLDLMVAAIEARDPYTSGHSKRVANASTIIARAAGLSSAQVERVTVAALLHDVGSGIPCGARNWVGCLPVCAMLLRPFVITTRIGTAQGIQMVSRVRTFR
jgi:hypothetical protein